MYQMSRNSDHLTVAFVAIVTIVTEDWPNTLLLNMSCLPTKFKLILRHITWGVLHCQQIAMVASQPCYRNDSSSALWPDALYQSNYIFITVFARRLQGILVRTVIPLQN